MEIKDSGHRKQFESGAVRDARPGVGRCDLLPLGIIADRMNDRVFAFIERIHSTRRYRFFMVRTG